MKKGINEIISLVLMVVFVVGASSIYYSWQNHFVTNTTKGETNETSELIKTCSDESIKLYVEYQDTENVTEFEDLDGTLKTQVDLTFNGLEENKTIYIYVYKNSTVDNATFVIGPAS